MGGELTFPGGGWYHASKHAVEALSDALRFELAGFGIDVVVIQPGLIRTTLRRGGRRLDRGRRRAVRTLRRGRRRGDRRCLRRRVRASARRRAGDGREGDRAGGDREAATDALQGDAVCAPLHHAPPPPRRPRLGRARRPQLPEAVGAGEALGEKLHEQRGRQADDVQVVALEPLRQGRRRGPGSRSRPRVPPTRPAPGGARAPAASARGRRRWSLVLDDLPRRREQAEAGHDQVRPP